MVPGTIYTDGSLIDGPPNYGGLCSRLGWAFVVMDAVGATIASAYGVPPRGAELWALQMASMHALPGSSFRVDCKSLLTTYQGGRSLATCSNQVSARIWNSLFTTWDDGGDVDLVWMPAHTTEAAAAYDELLLSKGAALTATDRAGNAAAESLAKRAAKATRVPVTVRRRIELAEVRVSSMGQCIGQVTASASHYLSSSGKQIRDVVPRPRESGQASRKM